VTQRVIQKIQFYRNRDKGIDTGKIVKVGREYLLAEREK